MIKMIFYIQTPKKTKKISKTILLL